MNAMRTHEPRPRSTPSTRLYRFRRHFLTIIMVVIAMLQEKSKVSGALDESIASFSDVLFVTPVSEEEEVVPVHCIPISPLLQRGRFELEMFASFFKLHGKSYSYKILYKSIKRLFMLNRPDQHVIFVVCHHRFCGTMMLLITRSLGEFESCDSSRQHELSISLAQILRRRRD